MSVHNKAGNGFSLECIDCAVETTAMLNYKKDNTHIMSQDFPRKSFDNILFNDLSKTA